MLVHLCKKISKVQVDFGLEERVDCFVSTSGAGTSEVALIVDVKELVCFLSEHKNVCKFPLELQEILLAVTLICVRTNLFESNVVGILA